MSAPTLIEHIVALGHWACEDGKPDVPPYSIITESRLYHAWLAGWQDQARGFACRVRRPEAPARPSPMARLVRAKMNKA